MKHEPLTPTQLRTLAAARRLEAALAADPLYAHQLRLASKRFEDRLIMATTLGNKEARA